MAHIIERDGRFTARVRLRGMRPVSRTFATRDEAEGWAAKAELSMLSGANLIADAQVASASGEAYQACGVYFLYKGAQCVYVGQSLGVHRRVQDHRKRLDFDVYSWTPVPPSQLAMVEQMYICMLRPALNSTYVHRGSR